MATPSNDREKWMTASHLKYSVQDAQMQLENQKQKNFETEMKKIEATLGQWLFQLPQNVTRLIFENPSCKTFTLPTTVSIKDVVVGTDDEDVVEDDGDSSGDDDVEGDEDEDDEDNAPSPPKKENRRVLSILPKTKADAIDKILSKYGFDTNNTLWTIKGDVVEIDIEYITK